MNLQNYYWYFQGVLTSKFCDEVIKYAKMHKEEVGITGFFNNKNNSNKEIKKLQKKRNSNIVWMRDKWIYKEILPYVEQANKLAGWNFDWDWSEACQFTKYSTNQHYGWHGDAWNLPYSKRDNLQENGKIRKLSVTCSLSDGSEYTGGELEFNFNDPETDKKKNIKKCTEILPRGSIVVFPSFVYHRVTPVKKGTRYSLVIWNLGYPYR